MSYSKTYEAYYPYRAGHNGQGIEYNFCEEETQINYDEYFSNSLDTYLGLLEDRYQAYCTIMNDNTFKNNNDEENSLLNNSKIFNQKKFEDLLIEKYNNQKVSADTNPWYGFIQLNNSFIDDFLEKLNMAKTPKNQSILNYLFDKNKYLKDNGTNITIDTYQPIISIDGQEITNANYIDREFYIGVGDYTNADNQNMTYSFRYVEFNKKIKTFQYLVNKIQIFAPLGTMFYINRVLHPIYINKEYKLGADNTIGIYELETNNYINIKYLTFPKDAIPKKQIWDESTSSFREENNDQGIIVTYYYDDVMELQEE